MSGSGSDQAPPEGGGGISAFQMQALTRHMERLMQRQNEEFHERLDQLEQRRNRDGDQRRRNNEEEQQPRANRLEGVKLSIPPFKGRGDPEAYLEWEMKIEHFFSCNNYTEEQRVKLAAAEFTDYALIWWNKLQRERLHYEEPLVDTWAEMRRIMRKRYVPPSHQRELKLKLQRLTQGNKSVEDYYKEMEVLMLQARVEEDPEITMARFMNGLSNEVRDVVELQDCLEIGDLLHKATQVEQQLKRKSYTRRSSSNYNSSSWRDKHKGDSSSTPNPATTTFKGKGLASGNKSPPRSGFSGHKSPTKGSGVKCFKCLGRGHYASECPNKRAMILKDNGEITSESSASESEKEEPMDEEIDRLPLPP